MKIAIVISGTGGHIYPGIAVAQEVKRRDSQAEVLFLGSGEGLERDILAKENFQFKSIRARALLRKISYKAFSAPFVSMIGFFESIAVLKSFSPKVLISFGGYASLPVVLAAKMLGIPVFIHEQNVLPGVVNRFCKYFARRVFLSFPETLKYLKGEVVGNPVRNKIIEVKREAARQRLKLPHDQKVILIMGGSQGSKRLNEILLSALLNLPSNVQVLHIIGKRDSEWVKRYLEGKQISNYHPLAYLYDIADALAAADLVVSRAGATAIAEFLVRGLPMILIPFPYAAGDHQTLNAKVIEKNNAGIMIKEADFSPEKLLSIINNSALNYVKMSEASKKLAKPEAAKKIVDYIYA